MLLLHNSQTKQEAAVGANVSVVSQGAQKPLVWVEAGPGRCSFVLPRAARLYSLCTARDFSSIMLPFLGSEQAGGGERADMLLH